MMTASWKKSLILIGVAALSIAAGGGRARAQDAGLHMTAPPAARPETWMATLGLRTMFIKDPDFDHFSQQDSVPQASLALSRVLGRRGRTALASGLVWDSGSSDGAVRGAMSQLTLNRLSILVEGRYRPRPRLFAFVRFAPGVVLASATLTDASASATLSDSFKVLSLDGSAGVAVSLTPPASTVGLWVMGEGGYSGTESHHVVLAPELSAQDQPKAGGLDFGTLALRGGFFRLAFGLSL